MYYSARRGMLSTDAFGSLILADLDTIQLGIEQERMRPFLEASHLALLSRRWYILHYHRSTLLLPLGERFVASGGGVGERSEVMYWHRGAYIIYYRDITGHSCIA